jgi:hypothetical protein
MYAFSINETHSSSACDECEHIGLCPFHTTSTLIGPQYSPSVDFHIGLLNQRNPQLLRVGRMRAHRPAPRVERKSIVDQDAAVHPVEV